MYYLLIRESLQESLSGFKKALKVAKHKIGSKEFNDLANKHGINKYRANAHAIGRKHVTKKLGELRRAGSNKELKIHKKELGTHISAGQIEKDKHKRYIRGGDNVNHTKSGEKIVDKSPHKKTWMTRVFG